MTMTRREFLSASVALAIGPSLGGPASAAPPAPGHNGDGTLLPTPDPDPDPAP